MWRIISLHLRRDRWFLLGWLAALVLTTAGSAKATLDLYDQGGRSAAEAINASPALVAMYGPIFDVDSIGALAIFKLLLLFGALMMIMFVVLVRRHTRLEEESGRAELVGGTAVGAHAPLLAAIWLATATAVLLGLLVAGGNIATGLPVLGSLSFGLAWTGLALFAASVSAVCAQLFANSRTVSGVVAGVIAVAYVVRIVGDLTKTEWLVWLSPFGWASRMKPYTGDHWLGWALLLATSGLGFALAMWLRRRRDLGSGLVPARPGKPRGNMHGFGALLLRLHRPGLIGWAIGLALLGALLGSIAPSAADFAESPGVHDMLRRVGGSGLLKDAFLAIEVSFMAVAATAYAIAVINRAASEERSGLGEPLLATPLSRGRHYWWVVGYANVAAALLMVVFGLAAGLAFGAAEGDLATQVPRLLGASIGQLPAVGAVIAVTALAFGLGARLAVAGWALLIGAVVVGQLGSLLALPDWVINASPYTHIAKMPVEHFSWDGGIYALLTVSIFATLIGWQRYRERNIG